MLAGQGVHYADRNEVRAIEPEPEGGALWYATGGGLVRLDPERGIHQVHSRSEGLPSADINGLVVLEGHVIVAASADRGLLLRSTSGRWTRTGGFHGLPDDRVLHAGLSDGQGPNGEPLVWTGTLAGARRMILRNGYLEPGPGSSIILPDNLVYDIAEDSAGDVYFATDAGIWRMDSGGNFTRYGTETGMQSLRVEHIEAGNGGAVYADFGDRIGVFSSGFSGTLELPAQGSPVTALRKITAGGQAMLTAASDGRAWVLDESLAWRPTGWLGTEIISLGPPLAESPEDVQQAITAGAPLLPAGTPDNGLYYPGTDGSYTNLNLPGPMHNTLTRVALDTRGTVWVSSAADGLDASRVGVSRYDGASWTHFTSSGSPLIFNLVSSLNPSPDGPLYLGTWFGPTGVGTGGFNILDDSGTADTGDDLWRTVVAETSGLPMGVIRGEMAFGPDGGVWVASQVNQQSPGGLERYDPANGGFSEYSAALPDRNVRTVAVDSLGNVWAGFVSSGLAVLPAGESTFRRVSAFGDVVPETGITDLTADPVGQLWIATTTKVVVLNFQGNAADQAGYAWREVKPPSFGGLAARDIEFQGTSRAWFATSSGVYAMSLDSREEWDTFDRGNSALASDDVHDLAVDTGRGVVWAATGSGLSALPLSSAGGEDLARDRLTVRPNPWYPERGQAMLAVSGMPRYSRMRVLTVSGELVRSFGSADNPATPFFWDGSNAAGRACASGVYLIVAESPEGRVYTGKVALVR